MVTMVLLQDLKTAVRTMTGKHTGMYFMQKPILKLAASTQSAKGATLYLTLSPCKECSKLILQAGITRLVYINEYSDDDGISFLRNHNIEIEQISESELKK
jgi:dCMP deaminase